MPYSKDKAAFSGYCRPAQFDVTDAVKAGDNQFTILADRYSLNELGTGGIVAPVLLYAPAAGEDAQLENVRDLKPTFP